jgi:hypothetical protein
MRSIVHAHLGQRSTLVREVLSHVGSGRLPVLFSVLLRIGVAVWRYDLLHQERLLLLPDL